MTVVPPFTGPASRVTVPPFAFTAVQAYEALVADANVRSSGEAWRTYAADFFGGGPMQTMLKEKELFTTLMDQIGTAYRAQKP